MGFIDFLDKVGQKPEPVRRRIYVLGIIGAILLSAGLWMATNKLSSGNHTLGASFLRGLETFRKISGQTLRESREGMANIIDALGNFAGEENEIGPQSSPKEFRPKLPLSE